MLVGTTEIREVTGITDDQRIAIMAFMQGAIYCWVKNRSDQWFAVRDLMGGENTAWRETPLMALYDKHIIQGKDHDAAFTAAAQDLGWLVKAVVQADRREFESRHDGFVNSYRWTGRES